MTYEELKNSVINKEEPYLSEINHMRTLDMGMMNIAEVLSLKYVGQADPKLVEDLMLHGIYDILMPTPEDGYNIDGMRNLAVAVIGGAAEEYRFGLQEKKEGKRYDTTAERFFKNGLCDTYLGVFDTTMTGEGIADSIRREVYGGDDD